MLSGAGIDMVQHQNRTARDIARMRLRMLAGDEVWSFSSPKDSWQMLEGRAGVALARSGHVVAYVVTEMS